jgi:hypothetical protein
MAYGHAGHVRARFLRSSRWVRGCEQLNRDDIEPLVRQGLSLRAIAAALTKAEILTPNSKRGPHEVPKAWSGNLDWVGISAVGIRAELTAGVEFLNRRPVVRVLPGSPLPLSVTMYTEAREP